MISGFADSDAWERRGLNVVARKRNSSYKEALRCGLPIEYFIDLKDAEDEAIRLSEEAIKPLEEEPMKSYEEESIRPLNIDDYSIKFQGVEKSNEGTTELLYIMGELPVLRVKRGVLEIDNRLYTFMKKKIIINIKPKPKGLPKKPHPHPQQKYPNKLQKKLNKLDRGEIRIEHFRLDSIKSENEWLDNLENILYNDIWEELRFRNSYKMKYSIPDCKKILQRLRVHLDISTHPTRYEILLTWNLLKKSILQDFEPIKIVPVSYRYFEWNDDLNDGYSDIDDYSYPTLQLIM